LVESDTDREAKRLIPKRIVVGTIEMDVLRHPLGEKRYDWYRHIDDSDFNTTNKLYELLNFMNGRRTLYEMVKSVSSEYTSLDMKTALRFVKDMEKCGFVKFV
jgi:hypothetical protein